MHAGQVDQMTLAHRFARAGFWLYPTSFEETSCITGMRAQVRHATRNVPTCKRTLRLRKHACSGASQCALA